MANTFQEARGLGAITYSDGQVLRGPLGSGATVVSFGGAQRRVIPAPVGDLEAARVASGVPRSSPMLRPTVAPGMHPIPGPRSPGRMDA